MGSLSKSEADDLYWQSKKTALQKRKELDRITETVNRILSIYENQFSQRVSYLLEIKRIHNLCMRGVPANGAYDYSNFSGSNQQAQANKHMDRAMYKKLAQQVHPDKGGSVEEFQALQKAYSSGDSRYIQNQFFSRFKESDPEWRAKEGIDHWQTEAQAVFVRLQSLKSTTQYTIAQLHQSGRKDLAEKTFGVMIEEVILNALNELLNYSRENYESLSQEHFDELNSLHQRYET